MAKKDKKKEEKPKPNSFSAFLKKRAPIYLGIMGLFLIFAVPQLTSNNLEGLFPEDLTMEEKEVLEIILNYSGPNEKGLTVLEAIDTKIKEEYNDDNVYNDKSSKVLIDITTSDEKYYDVLFVFENDKENLHYMWNVDIASHEISSQNTNAKAIIDLVDFYD